jgi:hypothetical protein
MAKPLADCRIRIEFPKSGKTYNFGLFKNPITRRILIKSKGSSEEVTPTALGARIARWIGGQIE